MFHPKNHHLVSLHGINESLESSL